jgi:hypothetical protein
MPEAQLNIRSTKAKNLASALAKRQRRTVSQIVELALEHYSKEPPQSKARNQDTANFWTALNASLYPTGQEADIDLEAIINDHRKPHNPVEF